MERQVDTFECFAVRNLCTLQTFQTIPNLYPLCPCVSCGTCQACLPSFPFFLWFSCHSRVHLEFTPSRSSGASSAETHTRAAKSFLRRVWEAERGWKRCVFQGRSAMVSQGVTTCKTKWIVLQVSEPERCKTSWDFLIILKSVQYILNIFGWFPRTLNLPLSPGCTNPWILWNSIDMCILLLLWFILVVLWFFFGYWCFKSFLGSNLSPVPSSPNLSKITKICKTLPAASPTKASVRRPKHQLPTAELMRFAKLVFWA